MRGNIKWHEACGEVYRLVQSEPGFTELGEPLNFKPIPDRRVAYDGLVVKYIQYVKAFQVLCECYKWLVHPQKRALLRRCVEAVAGRICEVKLEMIELDKSLYSHINDVLMDMGLTPDDIKLEPPKYLLRHRYRVLHMRERLLSLMIERMRILENPQVDDVICQVNISECPSPSTQISVDLDLPKDEYSTKICRRPEPTCKQEIIPEGRISLFVEKLMEHYNSNEAIQKHIHLIQNRWRGWLCRQILKRRREAEEIALGMRIPRDETNIHAADEVDYHKRETMWKERNAELEVSKTIEHERFKAAHGHNMAWALKYNITQWLLEIRDLQGSFPDYPTEEEGGCERLFAMKTTEEVEDEINEMLEKPPQGPVPKEKPAAQVKKPEVEIEGWKPRPTATVPKLIDALAEYNSYWYLKDEMDNVEQRFDRQLMLETVKDETSKQIRLQVDELMRYELDKLRCGIEYIEMDNKPKAKDTKADAKEKVTKDPLSSKTVEELFGELVLQGIAVPVQNIKLDSLLGEHNYTEDIQEEDVPNMADIKAALKHLVVFPLGSEFVHSVVPLTNRLLFAGSPGTGKTMMVHALCRETGANLFNISPHILADKYQGAEQQDYLMNALLKVGKSMEPTIFHIDGCEALYTKPVGHPGQDVPTRWAPVFYKMMDKMKKGDRMFLIGETTEPFTCNNLAMFNLFKNTVYFPRPDYHSRIVLWREFLNRMPICRRSLSLSSCLLAKFSEGYSADEIERSINDTLTANRLRRFRPLTNKEFILTLHLDIKSAPLTDSDILMWSRWYAFTPMMRRRKQMLDEEEAARPLQTT